MTWVRLEDGFHSNLKTVAVGNTGAGLYVRALSYCGDKLTDGWVPAGWVREVGGRTLPKKLLDAGLWITVNGGEYYEFPTEDGYYKPDIPGPGYFIPDYLLLNPSKEMVLAKRGELSQIRAEAGRKGGLERARRARVVGASKRGVLLEATASKTETSGQARGSKSQAKRKQRASPVPVPLNTQPRAVDAGAKEQPRTYPQAKPNLRPIGEHLEA